MRLSKSALEGEIGDCKLKLEFTHLDSFCEKEIRIGSNQWFFDIIYLKLVITKLVKLLKLVNFFLEKFSQIKTRNLIYHSPFLKILKNFRCSLKKNLQMSSPIDK